LSLARALARAGKPEEAARLYRTLLNAPPDARDEQGVGYRFYAAECLLAAKRDPDAALTFLRREIKAANLCRRQHRLPSLMTVRAGC
jgi:tetratricopeptide (TPR) repeat protein